MFIGKLRKCEAGQTMIEYVMLLTLVALTVFMAAPSITSSFVGVFNQTSSLLVLNEKGDPKPPARRDGTPPIRRPIRKR